MSEIIYGIHPIVALLDSDPSCFKKIYISNNIKKKRFLKILNVIKKKKISKQFVSKKWLNKYIKNKRHQGFLAEVYTRKKYRESDLSLFFLKKNVFFLILDCITDQHNLGACLRSANAAGVNAVIIQKKRSAKLNSVSKKISCGAQEYTPLIEVINISRTLRYLKKNNIFIIGTSDKAKFSLYQSNFLQSFALVVGREDKGIRKLTVKNCDQLIYIPTVGKISSLNVSVATGVCLFEALRQRLYS